MSFMLADHAAAHARLESITDRQREVLDLVVQHWTSKEIARELNISPNTVDQRINAVRAKLGAKDRAETARIYAELTRICGRTIYGPVVIAERADTQLVSDRDDAIDPVITPYYSAPSAPQARDQSLNRVIPEARLKDSKLWRMAAIVLIALGIVVIATTILAVMQALNVMI